MVLKGSIAPLLNIFYTTAHSAPLTASTINTHRSHTTGLTVTNTTPPLLSNRRQSARSTLKINQSRWRTVSSTSSLRGAWRLDRPSRAMTPTLGRRPKSHHRFQRSSPRWLSTVLSSLPWLAPLSSSANHNDDSTRHERTLVACPRKSALKTCRKACLHGLDR